MRSYHERDPKQRDRSQVLRDQWSMFPLIRSEFDGGVDEVYIYGDPWNEGYELCQVPGEAKGVYQFPCDVGTASISYQFRRVVS
jgi:hypothetical protein